MFKITRIYNKKKTDTYVAVTLGEIFNYLINFTKGDKKGVEYRIKITQDIKY